MAVQWVDGKEESVGSAQWVKGKGENAERGPPRAPRRCSPRWFGTNEVSALRQAPASELRVQGSGLEV